MALKTVTGKATNPDGSVAGNAEVRFVLSQRCTIPGTQEIVPAIVKLKTAADGTYSVALQANNDLTPPATYYNKYINTVDGGIVGPIPIQVPITGKAITAAVNNGAGLVRITAAAHGFSTGNKIDIGNVLGTMEANKTGWTITVIDANTFDLVGSAFVNAYVSGGVASLPFQDTLIETGVAPTASPSPGRLSTLTVDGAATFTAGPVTLAPDTRDSTQAVTEAVLVSGVNAALGKVVAVTLTANRVVGLPLNPAVGQEIQFIVTQGGAGSYTLTWPAGIKTAWQPAPVVGAISSLTIRYYGTNWQQVAGQVAVSDAGVLVHQGQAVVGGLTVVGPSGPYLSLLADGITPTPQGVSFGKQWDWAGMGYNVMAAGAKGDGTQEDVKLNAILGLIPSGAIVYWPTPSVNYAVGAKLTPKSNMVHRGTGPFAAIVRRLNAANQVLFDNSGLTGMCYEDMGFDLNAQNQASNYDGLHFRYDSHDASLKRLRFSNVNGFAIFTFSTPTNGQCNNFRADEIDIIPYGLGATQDVYEVYTNGGSSTRIHIYGVQGQLGGNFYESDNHPSSACTARLVANGSQGFAWSSTRGSPGIGHAVDMDGGATNAAAYKILTETDNANARPQLDQVLSGCTARGGGASNFAYQVLTAAGLTISGGTARDLGVLVQFAAAQPWQAGVTVQGVQCVNIKHPWGGTVPPFTKYSNNPGLNPFGKLAAVVVPGASTDLVNANHCDATYYYAGGTVTGLLLGYQAPVLLFATTSSTGGTLAPGTYSYRVTLVDQGGNQTMPSNEITIVVPAGTSTNTVTITWYNSAGADRGGNQISYQIYGRTTGAELHMASALVANTFTDDGSITPAGALPVANATALTTGMTSGPIRVPADMVTQWTGSVAPTAIAFGD